MNSKKGDDDKRFRELVENALVGISIIHRGRFIYLNTEQQRIFGDGHAMDRLRDLDICEEDHLRFEQICTAIETGKPLKKDLEIRFYPAGQSHSRKEIRYAIVRTDSIRYRSEAMTLLNMVDITHSKRMEHLALLRSKMISLGRISTGIAHELRSPLTGINLLVQGIRDGIETGAPQEELNRLLTQVEKATAKIEGVVKQVLDFARPAEPQVKPGNINLPLQAAIELSQTSIRKAGIEFLTHLDEKPADLFIDNHLMEQVFLNLIANGIAAVQDQTRHKTLEIRSEQQGNDILVSVSDSGGGIPAHLRSKVFDPFFSTKKSGTGIGLAICQRIVTDHGGTIGITESRLGGAQITIQLPIEKRQFTR